MSSRASGLYTCVGEGRVGGTQSLTECGLTGVSRLMRACDLTCRCGEGDGIRVYLNNRPEGLQVLTCANLLLYNWNRRWIKAVC